MAGSGTIYDHTNWISAFPDPDPENARIDGQVPNSTAASYEEAVNRVSQPVVIPIHAGGGMSYDFMGLSPVNRVNQPSTSAYRDRDLRQILEQSFLDEEGARHEPTSGLSEEAIDRHLRTRDHHDSRVSDDICVVCQDSLSWREDHRRTIATLDCGHDFHGGCIKPWLMRNNSCPLCKATGIRLH